MPLDLLGLITGLPADTARIPWDGPQVRILEHQAHAPGHAALLIEERGVLVAGDMLSDVLIPLLDLDAADPIEDYLAALRLLEGVADDVDVVIPGHGSVGGADQVRARIDQDRAYVQALRDGDVLRRPAVGPSATFEIGCPACMNGNYSTSPEAEPATGCPDEDRLASHDDPAKPLTRTVIWPFDHDATSRSHRIHRPRRSVAWKALATLILAYVRVLVTGMSGVGKSTLVRELRRRAFRAYDADDDGFGEPRGDGRWGWRVERVADVLEAGRGLSRTWCSSRAALRSRPRCRSTTGSCSRRPQRSSCSA